MKNDIKEEIYNILYDDNGKEPYKGTIDRIIILFDGLLSQQRKEIKEKIDWILTPHAYESDDPKMEKFALQLKEHYKKELSDVISLFEKGKYE